MYLEESEKRALREMASTRKFTSTSSNVMTRTFLYMKKNGYAEYVQGQFGLRMDIFHLTDSGVEWVNGGFKAKSKVKSGGITVSDKSGEAILKLIGKKRR